MMDTHTTLIALPHFQFYPARDKAIVFQPRLARYSPILIVVSAN